MGNTRKTYDQLDKSGFIYFLFGANGEVYIGQAESWAARFDTYILQAYTNNPKQLSPQDEIDNSEKGSVGQGAWIVRKYGSSITKWMILDASTNFGIPRNVWDAFLKDWNVVSGTARDVAEVLHIAMAPHLLKLRISNRAIGGYGSFKMFYDPMGGDSGGTTLGTDQQKLWNSLNTKDNAKLITPIHPFIPASHWEKLIDPVSYYDKKKLLEDYGKEFMNNDEYKKAIANIFNTKAFQNALYAAFFSQVKGARIVDQNVRDRKDSVNILANKKSKNDKMWYELERVIQANTKNMQKAFEKFLESKKIFINYGTFDWSAGIRQVVYTALDRSLKKNIKNPISLIIDSLTKQSAGNFKIQKGKQKIGQELYRALVADQRYIDATGKPDTQALQFDLPRKIFTTKMVNEKTKPEWYKLMQDDYNITKPIGISNDSDVENHVRSQTCKQWEKIFEGAATYGNTESKPWFVNKVRANLPKGLMPAIQGQQAFINFIEEVLTIWSQKGSNIYNTNWTIETVRDKERAFKGDMQTATMMYSSKNLIKAIQTYSGQHTFDKVKNF